MGRFIRVRIRKVGMEERECLERRKAEGEVGGMTRYVSAVS